MEIKTSEAESTRSSDTLRVLEELKSNGRLSLVVATDNGSPFVANVVSEFLRENKVIHLKSLPRVPQQNGSAENAVGEVKRLIREGLSRHKVCEILNEHRLRQTLAWKTSKEVEQEQSPSYTENIRSEFYSAAKGAIESSQLGIESAYEKRKAEREAIFQTLERFSLITRLRGRQAA